jgi:hypothetical protein
MSKRDLERLVSDYTSFDTSTPFSASDALSLAWHVEQHDRNGGSAHLQAYYRKAWHATTTALDLAFPEEALRCLNGHREAGKREPFFKHAFEPFFFGQLRSARKRIFTFVRTRATRVQLDAVKLL